MIKVLDISSSRFEKFQRKLINHKNNTTNIERQPPSKIFQAVSKLKDHQVKLPIDPEIPPVAEPPRPIAFHLRKKHNDAINKMEREGIIEEHQGPAPFISNTFPTSKEDGSLRITVDMRNSNKVIRSNPKAKRDPSKTGGQQNFLQVRIHNSLPPAGVGTRIQVPDSLP